MSALDVEVTRSISRSTRARQLEGSYDVPPTDSHSLRWHVDMPLDERDWSIGLIVGPSGCGKTTILRRAFSEPTTLTWSDSGVVDDFAVDASIETIASVCSAVGFNTIPAWLRPYEVLSNGERFRVELARRLVDSQPGETIVLDEFTSVVDRQVARIASHAAQRWVRRNDRRLVAATCHADVEAWLQPDWTIEPRPSHLDDAQTWVSPFTWRSVQSRPDVHVEITPATYEAWSLFAPFHYLTSSLNRAAKCYVLWAGTDDEHELQPAAFVGALHRPHRQPKRGPIWAVSRVVTLPDWQGLGLAFVLMDTLGSAYRAAGCEWRTYPAHPALVSAFDRSKSWQLVAAPQIKSTQAGPNSSTVATWRPGGRPNAVFRYVGPTMTSRRDAVLLFRCGR